MHSKWRGALALWLMVALATFARGQTVPLELRYFVTFPYLPDGITLREYCIPLGTMQRVNLTITYSLNVAYSVTRTFTTTVNYAGPTELVDAGPTRAIFFTHPQPGFLPASAPFLWVSIQNNDPTEPLQFGWSSPVEDGWGPLSPATTSQASLVTLGKRCLDPVGNNNQFQGIERFGSQPLNLTFPLRGVPTAQVFYPSTFQGLGVDHFPTNLISARGMFHKCPQQISQLPLILNAWNTEITVRGLTPFSTVQDMGYMFAECPSFVGHPIVSRFVTSNVTRMDYMFFQSPLFNAALSTWDTCKVTDMNNMFHGAASFNSNLRRWCVTGFTKSSAPSFFAFGASLMTDIQLPAWGFAPPLTNLFNMAETEVPKPAYELAGLNAYCAEPILLNNPARPCRRLLQAMPVYESQFNTSYNNYVAVEFYFNTEYGVFNQTTLLADFIAPGETAYVNATNLAAAAAANTRFVPQEITFAVPSCSSEPPRLVTNADLALGLQALGYRSRSGLGGGAADSAELGFVPLTVATACAGRWVLNYRPIPASQPSSLYDLNCGNQDSATNPVSFAECRATQLPVQFISPSNVYTAFNESWRNTTAPAPVVYDNLARGSLVSSAACASAGSDLWPGAFGIQYARTRGRCIQPDDIGGISPFWATLTYLIDSPSTCESFLAASPTRALQFMFKSAALISDPYTSARAAAPVRLRRRSADSSSAERIAYMPFGQCEPTSPRSLLATTLEPVINMQAHCRVARRGGAFNLAVSGLSNLFGLPNAPPTTVTVPMADGSIVYMVTADGIPFGSAKLYGRVRFETNGTLHDYTTSQLFVGLESRVFVTNLPGAAARRPSKVSFQRYSPDNTFDTWARDALVTGVDICQCGQNVECDVGNVLRTETELPIVSIAASSTSLVQPVCRIVLRDGYLGRSNWVLRNRVHTLDAKFFPYTGNFFFWDTSSDSAGFVQTQSQVAGQSSTPFFAFRVTAQVPTATMRLRITSSSGLTNFCDIELQVYEGEPVAELAPAEAFFGVGQTIELDGSRSFTPTGEDLFFFWRLGFPANTSGILLSQTGNVSRINVTAVQPGFYGVLMFACNPRTCRGVQSQLTVVPNPVPLRNNTVSNCFSSINNAIEFDPVQSPIRPAEFRAFSSDVIALKWGTAGDYEHADKLRAKAFNATLLTPQEVLIRQTAVIVYFTATGLIVLIVFVIVLVAFVALAASWCGRCMRRK